MAYDRSRWVPGYCPKKAKNLYKSARWRNGYRLRALNRHNGLCPLHLPRRVVQAVDVHHLYPPSEGHPFFADGEEAGHTQYLLPLCRQCHRSLHAADHGDRKGPDAAWEAEVEALARRARQRGETDVGYVEATGAQVVGGAPGPPGGGR